MATQRYISTSFWDDKWIQSLDSSEKLLYLYLMTNTLTNIAGVYKIEDRRISFDTGFNIETIISLIKKFEKAKKAYRYGEYIILPSWAKHQKWQVHKKIEAGIISILKELTPELLGYLKSIDYTYPIDSLSIPYIYPSNYSDTDTDTDINNSAKADSNESVNNPDIFPEEKKIISKEIAIKKKELKESKDTNLYHKIERIFLAEQLNNIFTNYGKEGKAINELIEKARARDPCNPDIFILGMINCFKELQESDKLFFGKQPFLPSALNAGGIFDRVLSEAQKKHEEIANYEPFKERIPL